MSTSDSGATWLSLLDDKEEDIKKGFGQGYRLPGDISNERSFRSAFEKFCSKRGEHKYSRLEAKLLPSLKPITGLAEAIGRSTTELQNLASNTKPEAVIWRITFALIEVNDLVP